MTVAHSHLVRLFLAASLLAATPAVGLARDADGPATGPRPIWLLLDAAMQPTGAREILSISGDAVGFIDTTGATVARPLSMVSLIVPAGWWTRTTLRGVGVEPMGEPTMPSIRQPGGLLETIDGQRVPGDLEFAVQQAASDLAKRPTRPSTVSGAKLAGMPPGGGAFPGGQNRQAGRPGQGGQPANPAGPTPGGKLTPVDKSSPTDKSPPAGKPESDVVAEGDDSIRWQHPTLGTLSFKLEQVRRWSVDQQPWAPAALPERDALLLANGDKLEGFVAGLVGNTNNSRAELAVKLEPASGDPVLLPVQRLRSMLLSGAPTLAAIGAARLILADGTDVQVGPMQPLVGGKLKTHLLASTSPESVVRIDAPLLVGFSPSARTLIDLAATLAAPVPPASPTNPEGAAKSEGLAKPAIMATQLLRTEPADLIAGSIDMPGWCVAVMTVPTDAKRIGMQVVVPEACRIFAECTLTVTLAGKLLDTRVLTAKDPVAELNIPVSGGGELRITLADGPAASGPVHDRVVLRRPIAFR